MLAGSCFLGWTISMHRTFKFLWIKAKVFSGYQYEIARNNNFFDYIIISFEL
jgi:hypothetical protein